MSGPYEGDSATNNVPGIKGVNTLGGTGVWGESTNQGQGPTWIGVYGKSSSTIGGAGVYGENTAGTGVTGVSHGNGVGVYGESQQHEGVHGLSHAAGHGGAVGVNDQTGGTGVFGTSPGRGVWGQSTGNDYGVVGNSVGGVGVIGTSEGQEGVHGESNSPTTAAVAGIALNPQGTGAGVYGESRGAGPAGFFKGNSVGGVGVIGTSEGQEGVHGESNSPTTAAVAGIALNPQGTGAGVYGESRGAGPAGFFKGNVVVTGDIFLQNADCAEDFDVAALEGVEPGSVMVIGHDSALQQSEQAYDKRVAGVVSGGGDYEPGIVLDRRAPAQNRKSIALLGKVYCKVDASRAPIEVGDLLTTSPNPGHAMKATDPVRAFGAVIGKALRPLGDGQGLIPILVALQ
jgi:hypothetical protein